MNYQNKNINSILTKKLFQNIILNVLAVSEEVRMGS